MNRLLFTFATISLLAAPPTERKKAMSFFEMTVNTLDGKPESLAKFKGKVVLAVNVASECGYTPQYEGLQKLYADYKDRGLVVLGFPCNQFGAQEPGTAAQIQSFCSTKFHVSFPMFEKLEVKGPNQAPVYTFLTAKHGEPAWNFHKYLVGKDGQVLAAYKSGVTPESTELRNAIEAALK